MGIRAAAPTGTPFPQDRFLARVDSFGHVILAGELDIACIETLRAALDQALLDGGEVIRIDAGQLSFIDSVAISEILHYQLVATTRQRRICFEHVSTSFAEILDLLDLASVLMEHPHTPGFDQTPC